MISFTHVLFYCILHIYFKTICYSVFYSKLTTVIKHNYRYYLLNMYKVGTQKNVIVLQCYGCKNVSTQLPFLVHKSNFLHTHVLRMHDAHKAQSTIFFSLLFLYSTSRLYTNNVCVCVKSLMLYNRLMNCLLPVLFSI